MSLSFGLRPFGGVPLDFESLNSVVYSSIYEFTLWHGITSVIFTICSSLYFICWHIAGDNQVIKIIAFVIEAFKLLSIQHVKLSLYKML